LFGFAVREDVPYLRWSIELFGRPAEKPRPAIDRLAHHVTAAVDYVKGDDRRASARPDGAFHQRRITGISVRQARRLRRSGQPVHRNEVLRRRGRERQSSDGGMEGEHR
jgi:hypothetical protein